MRAVTQPIQPAAPHLDAGELLYRLDGQFSQIVVVGLVAEGFRLNGHFGGTLDTGPLAGATMTGVDYFLLRHDGVGVVRAQEVILLGDQVIAAELTGLLSPPRGLLAPRPTDIPRPDFAWPSAPYRIHVSARFETAAPELKWLNSTVVAHGGTVNFATGRLHVEARVLG